MTTVRSFSQIFRKLSIDKMPYYAVRTGRNPGVYNSWPECQAQVNDFPQPRFKKFMTEQEAWEFVHDKTPEKPFFSSPSKRKFETFNSGAKFSPAKQSSPAKWAPQAATPPPPAPVAAPAPPGPPTRISSSRLLALKGTIQNMRRLSDQLRTYVTQAEDQMAAIEKGRKRPANDAGEAGEAAPSLAIDNEPVIKKQATMEMYSPSKSNSASSSLTSASSSASSSSEPVAVYTDGCCHSNGREDCRAGIGVFWGPGHHMNVAAKLDGRQTNNRAEIHAACRAIAQARECGITDLVIHTDSQFLINGITKWIHKWKKNGWKLSTGGQVINKEDFEELDGLLQDGQVSVTWVHVEGHAGIPGNEAADQLANQGARL